MRSITLILSLLLVVFAGTVYADRSLGEAQESVRYVDIQRCLTDWTALQAESNAIRDRYQAMSEGLNAANEDIMGRKAELESLDKTSIQFRDASFSIQIEEESLRARAEWTQKSFANDQTTLLERGVRQIHDVVRQIGEKEGFSAIMMHPNDVPALAQNFTPNDSLNEMNSRWVLWSNPAYDLTDQVLLQLNQQQ
ncbi:MAG: OmpH family outer membrane protein [Planctomycetota bacterium]|jgi:Skp family chaperone for outer membrane proteins